MTEFFAKIGDANKVISVQLSDVNGPKDVTGFTIVFHATHLETPSITISGTCSIVTAASGIISYTFTAANLTSPTIAGDYSVEWQATSGGTTNTWPDPGFDILHIQGQLA